MPFKAYISPKICLYIIDLTPSADLFGILLISIGAHSTGVSFTCYNNISPYIPQVHNIVNLSQNGFLHQPRCLRHGCSASGERIHHWLHCTSDCHGRHSLQRHLVDVHLRGELGRLLDCLGMFIHTHFLFFHNCMLPSTTYLDCSSLFLQVLLGQSQAS